MNLMEKILMTVVLLFILVGTAMWLYIGSLSSDLDRANFDLRNANNKIVSNEKKCDKDLDFCESQIKLEKVNVAIEKDTVIEVKRKVDKGEDYEIVASKSKSPECGCHHDGTGWVFK